MIEFGPIDVDATLVELAVFIESTLRICFYHCQRSPKCFGFKNTVLNRFTGRLAKLNVFFAVDSKL